MTNVLPQQLLLFSLQAKPQYSLGTWYMNDLWCIKPVYSNIYIAGQIKANYLPGLHEALMLSLI